MARIKALLPQWGMGMSEGKIVRWFKEIGDTISEDKPLAEVEAEKTTDHLESPVAGRLVEILVPEGETVAIIETA